MVDVVVAVDWSLVYFENDIAEKIAALAALHALKVGFGGGSARKHAFDNESFFDTKNTFDMSFGVFIEEENPQSWALNFPVLDQLGHQSLDGVHWNRKADPRTGATVTIDEGVHANQLARRIKEGASGVTGVD